MQTLGRYTNTLQVEKHGSQHLNELGDLVSQSAVWVTVSLCREEPSGAGTEVQGNGASAIKCSSEVYMPATCTDIVANTLVRVLSATGEVQITGRVLRFKRFKHYAKLWI